MSNVPPNETGTYEVFFFFPFFRVILPLSFTEIKKKDTETLWDNPEEKAGDLL